MRSSNINIDTKKPTSSYSRGPAASLADFPRAISWVADPDVTCFTSKAPGSEHVTVTDLYDRIGQMHLLWSRSLTANAGSQQGSPSGIVCNAMQASGGCAESGRRLNGVCFTHKPSKGVSHLRGRSQQP